MNLDVSIFYMLIVATCLMVSISYLSFRKRQLAVAKYGALVMLAASFYTLGYAFELISGTAAGIQWSLRFEYIGIPFISTFWFILVLHYTGHQASLNKRAMMLLFTVPVITFVLHSSNGLHHLYYSTMEFVPGGAYQLDVVTGKGTWYWVQVVYNNLLAVIGTVLFWKRYMQSVPVVRKQILILMLGAVAPWICNGIYLLDPFLIGVDLTPLGFTLSGLFYLWGIYRYNLLRLVPVAMQTVFETMEDGVIILDYDANIMNANKSAVAMFARSAPLDGPALAVFADYPELAAMVANQGQAGGRFTIPLGDDVRHYDLSISSLHDKSNTQLGRMLVVHDVTQVVRYQEQIQTSASQLAAFSAFKDNVFQVVTHDIRNPLAMLVNATELLEESHAGDSREDMELLREVAGQVKSTYLLVEQLLEWFRSQSEKTMYNPRTWNVAACVEEAVQLAAKQGEQKGIAIHSDIDHKIGVLADKEMLSLVLRNLLSNAVKFTGRGGSVHIGAASDGAMVTLSIRDSGIGIDEERGNSLFHGIQQASSGTEGEKGTGLGLYLAEKFVSMHGGRIWYERNSDQGSTFFFTFPQDAMTAHT
jgi:signal transduction histidine kinase